MGDSHLEIPHNAPIIFSCRRLLHLTLLELVSRNTRPWPRLARQRAEGFATNEHCYRVGWMSASNSPDRGAVDF